MITVQDILAIPDLRLRLLAGAGATANPVRWVHITEVEDPTAWLRGGELLLTTGHEFVGSESEQTTLLEKLIDHQISGLGFGIGTTCDEVPAALVELAEKRDFPLFEIPSHVPFIAITEAVASKIVNEQYALLQRSLAVHEKLTKIVLEGKGFEAILETLATLVGCSAVLFDFNGVLLCAASHRRRLDEEAVAALWRHIVVRRADRRDFALEVEGFDSGVQAYPVVASHRIGAFLAAVKDGGDFSEYDQIILHSVVTVTALELVKKKAVADAEQRLAGDFFDQLIAGDLYEAEIARRLSFFGLDPAASHLVILVHIDDWGAVDGGGRRVAAQELKERLHWAVDEFMARRDLMFVSASRNEAIVLLLEPGSLDGSAVTSLVEELHSDLHRLLPGCVLSAGVGRPHDVLSSLRRSYFEASYAIQFRQQRGERGVIAGFRDLGSYGLLLGLHDTLSLEVFADSVLGALLRYDAETSSDLVHSLAAFLEANGHWGDAADGLYVHRHTLRYRMKRVEEISGRDLTSSQDRMDFWLALKARELVDRLAQATPGE